MMQRDDAGAISQAGTSLRAAENAVIGLFLLVALALVVCFRFPPLLDFANHYARAWLITGGIAEPPFADIYALDWSRTSTNIGMDAVILLLGPVFGVDLVMRTLLWLAIVMPPLGAVALYRGLWKGGNPWILAAFFFAWCATMLGGFLNFQIGLGLALFAAALDHRMRTDNPLLVFAIRAAVSLILIYEHIFALGFYMVLLGGLALGPDIAALRAPRAFGRALGRIALIAAACLAPLALVMATAKSLPGAHAGLGLSSIEPNMNPVFMFAGLMSAFWTYWLAADLVLLAVLALVLRRAVKARDLRLHGGLVVAFVLLFVLSLLSPVHALGTGWISWRFPIMAALVGVVMLRPFERLDARKAMLLLLLLGSVVMLRTAVIGYNWWRSEADVLALRSVIAEIPAGASVLPVIHHAAASERGMTRMHRYYAWQENTFRHLPTLAVPLAHAFVPTLFTAAGKQPLAVKPQWLDRSVPETSLLSIHALQCKKLRALEYSPYLEDWRAKFDYVLVINADVADEYAGDAVPPGLDPVAGSGFARLYRIDKAFGMSDGPFACAANVPDL